MNLIRRSLAAVELLLVFPAVLFMAVLFVRNIQPAQFEPAHTAQLIVDWYAARQHLGLWVLLIALPLAVVAIGMAALMREWHRDSDLRKATRQTVELIRAHFAPLVIAMATATAGAILAIVALHVITD